MQIRNLKLPDAAPAPAERAAPLAPADAAEAPNAGQPGHAPLADRHALETALLKARIQHLELIVETARSLMGSNQERLLRQLHDTPREIAALSAQLRRIDPHSAW